MKASALIARLSLGGGAWIAVILINLPVLLVVLGSFQSTSQIVSSAGVIPSSLTLDNYHTVLERTPFFTYLANSLIIGVGTMVLSVGLSLLSGYALSRF